MCLWQYLYDFGDMGFENWITLAGFYVSSIYSLDSVTKELHKHFVG
jgi:hypothetical protein